MVSNNLWVAADRIKQQLVAWVQVRYKVVEGNRFMTKSSFSFFSHIELSFQASTSKQHRLKKAPLSATKQKAN